MSKQEITKLLGAPVEKLAKAMVPGSGEITGDVWVFRGKVFNRSATWWVVFESDIVSRVDHFIIWGHK